VVKAFQRITQYIGNAFYRILLAYYHHPVTYLQGQMRVGKQVHSRTVDTGDINTKHATEVHISQLLSVNF